MWVRIIVTLLITPLITTHEAPSRLVAARAVGKLGTGLFMSWCTQFSAIRSPVPSVLLPTVDDINPALPITSKEYTIIPIVWGP